MTFVYLDKGRWVFENKILPLTDPVPVKVEQLAPRLFPSRNAVLTRNVYVILGPVDPHLRGKSILQPIIVEFLPVLFVGGHFDWILWISEKFRSYIISLKQRLKVLKIGVAWFNHRFHDNTSNFGSILNQEDFEESWSFPWRWFRKFREMMQK